MHEHQFFGNLSIDGSTTADTDLRGQPSTCQGGPVNATGYWTPTLYQAGQRVDPLRMLVYYKSPRDSQDVDQFLPAGLRMISDDGSWRCRNNRGGTHTSLDALAAAAGGSCNGAELRGTIHFPQCWDGVRLDSPDHRSHMAYAVGGVCPGTHPVLLPQVEEFIDYPGDNIRQLTISSDLGAEPGTTLHADWMNGWDAAAVDIIMEHCIQAGKSCNAGDMGDGRQLTGSNTIDDIN